MERRTEEIELFRALAVNEVEESLRHVSIGAFFENISSELSIV